MNTPTKGEGQIEIQAEEIYRIHKAADDNVSALANGAYWGNDSNFVNRRLGYIEGAKAEYLRHLSPSIEELQDQLEEKNAEIELLRNNGASLRPGTSVLDVLKWAVDHEVVKESGYWRKNYSSIAYTDERIVEEFYKDHPGRTPEQQKAAEKARAIAFASYALGSVSKAFSSLLEVYAQFEIDEAEKIKTGQI